MTRVIPLPWRSRDCLLTVICRVLLLASLVLSTSLASAEERYVLRDPLAIDLKRVGDTAMQGGHYQDALDAYSRASQIEGSPILTFNRGRALQGLNRVVDAVELLEAFERDAPDDLKARVPGLLDLLTTLRAQVATLEINLSEEQARLLVDGTPVVLEAGATSLRLRAGVAKVQASLEGYVPYEQTLKLTGGKTRLLSIELIRSSTQGLLQVRSKVEGARARIGKEDLGTVPAELTLDAGQYRLEVDHPDYRPYSANVVIEARQTRIVDIELERRPRFYERWWFWAGVGVVVAGTTATVIAATTERRADEGDIPPGQVTVPVHAGAPLQLRF